MMARAQRLLIHINLVIIFDFVVVLVTRSILYTSAVTELLQKYLMIYYKHIN